MDCVERRVFLQCVDADLEIEDRLELMTIVHGVVGVHLETAFVGRSCLFEFRCRWRGLRPSEVTRLLEQDLTNWARQEVIGA